MHKVLEKETYLKMEPPQATAETKPSGDDNEESKKQEPSPPAFT
jgi:hypothetical protein